MDQNKISSGTLVQMWDLWKTLIHNMLSCLHHPDETNEIYEEFYLNYFGIRKDEDLNACVLQDLNAAWIETSELSSLEKSKISLSMSPLQCMSCAQHYWKAELSSVGMKILEKLESLHNFASERNYSLFSKLDIIICLYKVAKYLKESEFVVSRIVKNIERYFILCRKIFSDMVFPLDWTSQTVATLELLQSNDIVVEIIEGILIQNLKHRPDNLSFGFISRFVMSIFLTGRLTDDLFTNIMNTMRNKPAWNNFVELLKTFLDFGYTRIPLITRFKEALQSTFEANWSTEKDYVSPHCFLYLLDCLMFFASSCQGYQGYFLTTKSALIEMLKCQGCNGYIANCLVAVPDVQLKASVSAVLDYIIYAIQQLLCDKNGTKEWIKKTSVPKHFYSEMVLKLVIMLFLAFLNTGRHPNSFSGFLSRFRVWEDLPRAFSKRLRHTVSQGGTTVRSSLMIFADALRTVENLLLVVCSRQNRSLFTDLNALVISSEEIRCRDNILELLFPEIKRHVGPVRPSSSTTTTHISNSGNKIDSVGIPIEPERKGEERDLRGHGANDDCLREKLKEVDSFNRIIVSQMGIIKEENPDNCEELISRLMNIQDDLDKFSLLLRDAEAKHGGKSWADLE